MKKLFLAVIAASIFSLAALAQNDKADNILGKYSCGKGKDAYKVEITKQPDGNYKCQVIWVADALDKDGKPNLDVKNPDKSLRNVPLDRVVIMKDLKYNPEKKNWGGTKIYDPGRGIRVTATLSFDNPKTLKVRGTVMGIGETVVWERI